MYSLNNTFKLYYKNGDYRQKIICIITMNNNDLNLININ